MKKWKMILLIALVAAVSAGAGAYAAGNYGTQSDPLVTLSYLNDTLAPAMRSEFDAQLYAAVDDLESKVDTDIANASGSFAVVTVSSGKTLSAAAGCEILYRAGSAVSVGTLVDVSAGEEVAAGTALTANHLYTASAAGDGLKASGTVTLLVRGTYSIV